MPPDEGIKQEPQGVIDHSPEYNEQYSVKPLSHSCDFGLRVLVSYNWASRGPEFLLV